jgi:hypothetical protein
LVVLIDARTAAHMLGVSVTALHKLRKAKRLRAVRKSPFRFSLAAVEELRKQRETQPRRGPATHGVEFVMEPKA